jgi:hypothetical protein
VEEFASLDDCYKATYDVDTYPVEVSAGLQSLKNVIERETVAVELEPFQLEKELGES